MEVTSIQYLRGCAALMVVFHHLELQINRLGYTGYWPHCLESGVDIFFVISGFIMWITTAKGATVIGFYQRRLLRIAPLYWVLTTVLLAVLVIYPRAMQSAQFDSLHILGSYLFFPVLHPTDGYIQPLLIPGWTLNYEMFFYAIFGASLMLPATQRLLLVSAILYGLALVPVLAGTPETIAIQFYTSNIIIEFAFGATLGWLYISGAKLPAPFSLFCILSGAVLLVIGEEHSHSGLLIGLPSLLIVAGTVFLERAGKLPKIHVMRQLGDASYSIYLSHTIVLSAAFQMWRGLNLQFTGDLIVFGAMAVALSIAAGILLYDRIETPMLKFGRMKLARLGGIRSPIAGNHATWK